MEENETMNEVIEEMEDAEFEKAADEMWDDDSIFTDEAEVEETPSEEDNEEFTETESEADQPIEEVSETDDSDIDNATETVEEVPSETRKFTLKHLDETREVDETEVVTLAQKGMDYDRVRDKLNRLENEVKTYQDFLDEIKGAFPTREALIDDTRAKMLSKKEKISYSEALEKVKANRQPTQKDIGIDEFVRAYPNLDATSIPKEVWDDVNITGNLKRSYEYFTDRQKFSDAENKIKELEKENEILKQNNKNASRSTGSMKTSGKGKQKSVEEDIWDEIEV